MPKLFQRRGRDSRDEEKNSMIKKTGSNENGYLAARHCVILTGSTGNMGAYILDKLMQLRRVDSIICMNRSGQARERQIENHRVRGLLESEQLMRRARCKVEFVQCDLSRADLGVSPPTYQWIRQNATHIVHNAWPVDFNKTFASFEPQILGVQHLIELTKTCVLQPLLFFVSSISVVARWGTVAGALDKVPEVELEDWRTAKMGYGQSKLVSERLLLEASRTCGIRVAICRVGQVAGPVLRGEEGSWNRQEWLPSLIASSQFMRKLPETLGPMDEIDWIPVDVLGQVMVELLFSSDPGSKGKKIQLNERVSAVYHVSNSKVTSWSSLLHIVMMHLGEELEVVSFVEWVDALEVSAKQREVTEDPAVHPAAKLLTFFDDLRDKAIRFPKAKTTMLDTTKTRKRSRTLNDLEAVNIDWMNLWMRQWHFA